MIQSLCRWLLYKRMGYRFEETVKRPRKYIIALAPHTSNWDFIVALLFMGAEKFQCGFMMKKEWFFWPLGPIFRHMGGIPVYRDKNHSVTDILAQKAREAEDFHLCITPEGTRRLQPEWKRGFYYIALKAELPILLYAIDYPGKRIVCTKVLHPSGNVEQDMKIIMDYYRPYQGKYPDKFAVEEIGEASGAPEQRSQ